MRQKRSSCANYGATSASRAVKRSASGRRTPSRRAERSHACSGFLKTGADVLYQDRAREGDRATRKKKASSKTEYTCPGCGLNAWVKPAAPLVCGECEEEMQTEPDEDD